MRSIKLTPKEKQIILLLLQDKSYKKIGFELGISKSAVGFHMSNLIQKLGAHSQIGVAVWACRNLNDR